ncbi:hypothetical protein [Streptomyces sp. NPDC002516]
MAGFLPDQAGRMVLRETADGVLGPWSGLAVTDLRTAAALGAGAGCVRRRDV